MPVPAGIMDKNGRIIEVNQQALNIISQLPQWSIQNHTLSLKHLDLSDEIRKLNHSDNNFCSLPLFYENTLDNV
jgi:hypothetical protein